MLLLLALTSYVTGEYREGHFEKSFQVSGKVVLDVDSAAGNITVHTGGAQTLQISARIRARGSFVGVSAGTKVERIQANPPVREDGNVIRITKIEDSSIAKSVFY